MKIEDFEKKVGGSLYLELYIFLCKEGVQKHFKMLVVHHGTLIKTRSIRNYVYRFKELDLPAEDLIKEAFDYRSPLWNRLHRKWARKVLKTKGFNSLW